MSRNYDDYQVHQKIQIEEETLKFLRKSRRFKRPPQSIRISGANVMEESEKLRYFSNFESILLDQQIKKKEIRIKELKDEAKTVPYLKLPFKDKMKLANRFKKKLKFYALQDTTKWQHWPVKSMIRTTKRSETDKKLETIRRRKRSSTERQSEMHREPLNLVQL